MSNDFISRSAVIKEINEYLESAYDCDGIEGVSDFQRGNESKQSYIVEGLYEAFELIRNVPTAYDVDKIVDRIGELEGKSIPRYKDGTFGDYEGMDYYVEKSEVERIIKTGGI